MHKKICFVVNHASFFVSHRLQIAIEAKNQNYDVVILFGKPSSMKTEPIAINKIIDSKIKFIKLNINNQKMYRFLDLIGLLQLFFFVIKYKPNIIHSVSPIANLIAGMVAIFFRNLLFVVSISGMGYIFTGTNLFKKIYSNVYLKILYFVLLKKNKKIIVQNSDDYKFFENNFNVKKNLIKIQGSGIDLNIYKALNFDKKQEIILFPARLVKEKGICEFLQASVGIRSKFPSWRILIAGQTDYQSPSLVKEKFLIKFKLLGIEFIDYEFNISELYKNASIVCLPSYREGMPKALLEASAAGCAIITSDTIGCREAIIDNFSGELVPIKNSEAIFTKLNHFIENKNLRNFYGINARKFAFNNFSIKDVIDKHLNIYNNFNEK